MCWRLSAAFTTPHIDAAFRELLDKNFIGRFVMSHSRNFPSAILLNNLMRWSTTHERGRKPANMTDVADMVLLSGQSRG
jgi:hypothetical protein